MELSDFERQVLLNLEYYQALKLSERAGEPLAWTRAWKKKVTLAYRKKYGCDLVWMRPMELFDHLDEVEGSAAFQCVLLGAVLYEPFYPLEQGQESLLVDEKDRLDFLSGILRPYVRGDVMEDWLACFRRQVVDLHGKLPVKSFQEILMKNWQYSDEAVLMAALFEPAVMKKKVWVMMTALKLTEIREIFIGQYKDYRYCEMLRAKAEEEDPALADAIKTVMDDLV